MSKKYEITIRGPRARNHLVSYLQAHGYEVIHQTPILATPQENDLLVIVGGKISIYDFLTKLNTHTFVCIRTKTRPHQEIAIRKEENKIHIAFFGAEQCGYILMQYQDFRSRISFYSAWLFSAMNRFFMRIKTDQVQYEELLVPESRLHAYQDFSEKMSWNWRNALTEEKE